MRVRVGTRGSRLALIQAESVAAALRARGAEVEIVPIRTSGDQLAQVALADFGGKALFVKEIEEALLDGRVDVGVHSLKDMPAVLPAGLTLAAYPPREDPADVLVARGGAALADLPPGGVVGTSSLRRRVLLLRRRPDLRAEPIRGNVDTRLRKLEAGDYDALVMARAGLRRLGVEPPGARALPLDTFPPAVGQGILGVEARAGEGPLLELLATLDHTETRMQAEASAPSWRASAPAAIRRWRGWPGWTRAPWCCRGWWPAWTGSRVLEAMVSGAPTTGRALGEKLAEELLARGAGALLDASGGD
jgi:hydroxymethylbilane synthase